MIELSWYLLESSIVLSVFYALYALLLRSETFFEFNRFYLLAIVLVSLLAPLLSWDFIPEQEVMVGKPIEQVRSMRQGYFEAMDQWYLQGQNTAVPTLQAPEAESFWNWKQALWNGFLSIYIIGVLVVWSRLGWMLYALYGFARRFPSEYIQGVRVVRLPERTAPFSFLRTVFVNSELLDSDEFHQVLAHEQVHIRQRHSIDLIIVQILAAGLWFHPLVWRLLKSLKTTHEYIADKQMISLGHSLVEYQSLLLSQLISNQSYGLVHNFNLSFIKKRITMMKIKQSGWSGRAKVAVTLSLAIIISITLIQCNSNLEESTVIQEVPLKVNSNDFTQGVNLPVVQSAYNSNQLDITNPVNLHISIFSDQITFNGKLINVEDLYMLIYENHFASDEIVVLRVDANQSMLLVQEVQNELRRLDKRKILYLGQNPIGEMVQSRMLLPPYGESQGVRVPDIDEEYVAMHDITLKTISLSSPSIGETQKEVKDFINSQIAKGNSNYVVLAQFEYDKTFDSYLNNFIELQDAFNAIYDERARRDFGKGLLELTDEEFKQVRKGIPRSFVFKGKGC